MTALQLAILSDPRLSDGARVLALWMSEQAGEEGVELRFDTVRETLYGFPGDDMIRRHLRMLAGAKWISRLKAGGRGHGDTWILASAAPAPYPIRVPSESTLNTDSPRSGPTLNAVVVVEEEVVVNPPVVPPLVGQVSERAEELIEANAVKLEGCRGALRDYLAARVPPDRQRGYVGSLLGWLDGTDGNVWMTADGTKLPPDKRTATLAAALNELGTADEEKQRKWSPGDVQNLRNKIEAILRPKPTRPANGTPSGGGSGSGARGTPRGTTRGPGINALWGDRGDDRATGGASA